MKYLFLILLAWGCSSRDKKPEPQPVPAPPDAPSVLPLATTKTIITACQRPEASDVNLSYGECVLVLAGSASVESTWNVDKSCEPWGMPSDPACGLTQSRRSDAVAVGLRCDPSLQNPEGYVCNALTGLRNLRCKSEDGKSCDRYGAGRSLELGIRKHLGGNQAAFPNYLVAMQRIYNDPDVRRSLRVQGSLRPWEVFVKAQQQKS